MTTGSYSAEATWATQPTWDQGSSGGDNSVADTSPALDSKAPSGDEAVTKGVDAGPPDGTSTDRATDSSADKGTDGSADKKTSEDMIAGMKLGLVMLASLSPEHSLPLDSGSLAEVTNPPAGYERQQAEVTNPPAGNEMQQGNEDGERRENQDDFREDVRALVEEDEKLKKQREDQLRGE
jgi:hypothetical protein